MPTVSPLPCASVATLSAADCELLDAMITVQPSPPGKPVKVDPVSVVVLSSGVALASGVAVPAGLAVAVGAALSVGSGDTVALGIGLVVGTAACGAGVGVGASFSPPPESANSASTTPRIASRARPPASMIGTRQPRGSATSVEAAAPQARHHS